MYRVYMTIIADVLTVEILIRHRHQNTHVPTPHIAFHILTGTERSGYPEKRYPIIVFAYIIILKNETIYFCAVGTGRYRNNII